MMEPERGKALWEKTAKIISYTFHPLLVPLYGLLVIFFAPTVFWYLPIRMKEILLFIFLINNILIPLSMMPFLKYRNVVSSWSLDERSERVIPLFGISILYGITSFIMFRLPVPLFLKAFAVSLGMVAVFLFFINLKWKISLHSAGAGAITAVVFVLSLNMGVPLPLQVASSILLSGAVMSSRLVLNFHEPAEVYTGFFTGFIVQGLFLILLQ
jgi:hypothetical protein